MLIYTNQYNFQNKILKLIHQVLAKDKTKNLYIFIYICINKGVKIG